MLRTTLFLFLLVFSFFFSQIFFSKKKNQKIISYKLLQEKRERGTREIREEKRNREGEKAVFVFLFKN